MKAPMCFLKVQNLWDAAKSVLRGKFIAIQSHSKKQEKSQINNLKLHLKQLEKEQIKSKVSRREEIIKRNKWNTKKTLEKINETKSQFFEKIDTINKPLTRLTYFLKRTQVTNMLTVKLVFHQTLHTPNV